MRRPAYQSSVSTARMVHTPHFPARLATVQYSSHLMNPTYGPCYTCRNRRIQCDQSGVPCAKCEKAGLQCFDKRPIRWVKGVAIRGKMQGRSYEPKNGAPSTTEDYDPKSSRSRRSVVKSTQGRIKTHGMYTSLSSPILCHSNTDPFNRQDTTCLMEYTGRYSRTYIIKLGSCIPLLR